MITATATATAMMPIAMLSGVMRTHTVRQVRTLTAMQPSSMC